MTINNLGLLRTDQNREEASKEYDEALAIHRKLAGPNPQTFFPYAARLPRAIGRTLTTMSQRAQAQRVLQEALDIFQDFAHRNPPQYQLLRTQ